MGDSVNPWAIPTWVDMVLVYIDGAYAWTQAGRDRFAGKPQIEVACFASTNRGLVGDVESGCMTPAEAAAWARMRRRAGAGPGLTLYVNKSNEALVRAALAAIGEPVPLFGLAFYDNVASLPPGYVFKQYANSAFTGSNYDLSIVADSWPGVDSVFGPGGGTLGDEVLDQADPVVLDILKYLDRLDTNVKDLYFALGLQQPNPADPTQAKSAVLAAIHDAIGASSAGGSLTQQQITDAVVAALKTLTLKSA